MQLEIDATNVQTRGRYNTVDRNSTKTVVSVDESEVRSAATSRY